MNSSLGGAAVVRRLGVLAVLVATGMIGLADRLIAAEPTSPAGAPARPVVDSNADAVLDQIFLARKVRAPSLEGGAAWINAGGPIDLKDLKGKFVLLDFWTFCCINCMHIMPELQKLEHAFPNNLVVIGVHSAKFEAEQDTKHIAEAVLRYEIEHPVVNDPQQKIWERFEVNSWPTLVLIDPEGFILYHQGGEFKADSFLSFFSKVIPYYRKKGLLNETPLRFDLERYRATQTPLRFPGKIIADEPGQRLFISDSNHNRIVIAGLDGTLLDVIGSGETGTADGDYATAQFNRPQGMALDGETLYVADTENHLLRKIDLKAKRVATAAGTGKQAGPLWPGMTDEDLAAPELGGGAKAARRFVGPPRTTAISSPWDLWVNRGLLFIAMAGNHQIWRMPLRGIEIGPYAGNGREDIVDGPLLGPQPYASGFASFAQPSGLTSDGQTLFVADSEGASIRAVPLGLAALKAGEVKTIVGTADLASARLFTFGDVDGPRSKVRLQHPLGLAWHDGGIYVADTYNNKIKRVDPMKGSAATVAGSGQAGTADGGAHEAEFNEPTGLCYAAGRLFVADTNNHRIRTIDLARDNQVATLEIKDLKPPAPPVTATPKKPNFADAEQVRLPEARVKPADGAIHIVVKLALPEGFKMNPLAPERYYLEASGEKGPIDRAALGKLVQVDPSASEFDVRIPLKATSGRETLRLSLNYYYCQEKAEGVCKVGAVTWTIPVVISEAAKASMIGAPLNVEK